MNWYSNKNIVLGNLTNKYLGNRKNNYQSMKGYRFVYRTHHMLLCNRQYILLYNYCHNH